MSSATRTVGRQTVDAHAHVLLATVLVYPSLPPPAAPPPLVLLSLSLSAASKASPCDLPKNPFNTCPCQGGPTNTCSLFPRRATRRSTTPRRAATPRRCVPPAPSRANKKLASRGAPMQHLAPRRNPEGCKQRPFRLSGNRILVSHFPESAARVVEPGVAWPFSTARNRSTRRAVPGGRTL